MSAPPPPHDNNTKHGFSSDHWTQPCFRTFAFCFLFMGRERVCVWQKSRSNQLPVIGSWEKKLLQLVSTRLKKKKTKNSVQPWNLHTGWLQSESQHGSPPGRSKNCRSDSSASLCIAETYAGKPQACSQPFLRETFSRSNSTQNYRIPALHFSDILLRFHFTLFWYFAAVSWVFIPCILTVIRWARSVKGMPSISVMHAVSWSYNFLRMESLSSIFSSAISWGMISQWNDGKIVH